MSNRRQFFREAAGIVFTGCGLLHAQGRTGGAATHQRRPVTVGGRPVKTVDVHAHCAVPDAMKLMGMDLAAIPGTSARWDDPRLVVGTGRLQVMDEQGIDVEALSINAYWYAAEREKARDIIRIQNEAMSRWCAAEPARFVAYASVALQFPDLAAEQLEEGVKKLGLRGAAIGGHVNGDEISSRKFEPFWAKAEELGAVVFVHPQGIPELEKRLQGNGYLTNVIGNPLETTIALSHLIFDGTLDRFPGLKICAAHGGGYLASYADRSDHGCVTFPDNCDKKPLQKRPTEYLRQLYFDSLVFSSEALRHLVAQVGSSQIVMGTDYPFPWTSTAVDHILETSSLSDAERRAILGGTAAKLLRIT